MKSFLLAVFCFAVCVSLNSCLKNANSYNAADRIDTVKKTFYFGSDTFSVTLSSAIVYNTRFEKTSKTKYPIASSALELSNKMIVWNNFKTVLTQNKIDTGEIQYLNIYLDSLIINQNNNAIKMNNILGFSVFTEKNGRMYHSLYKNIDSNHFENIPELTCSIAGALPIVPYFFYNDIAKNKPFSPYFYSILWAYRIDNPRNKYIGSVSEIKDKIDAYEKNRGIKAK